MSSHRDTRQEDAALYRIEVEGRMPATWQDRFGAHSMGRSGENTVLEIRVRDQSELFGRLRRVHDLNLRLISVALIPAEAGAPDAPATTTNSNARGDSHAR